MLPDFTCLRSDGGSILQHCFHSVVDTRRVCLNVAKMPFCVSLVRLFFVCCVRVVHQFAEFVLVQVLSFPPVSSAYYIVLSEPSGGILEGDREGITKTELFRI